MIKRGIYITSFLLVLGFIISFTLFYLKPVNTLNLDVSLLKNGDLILRKGRSVESYAVYSADKEAEFTHIGMIVYENKIPFVIHAVPHKNKTLKKESVQDFLKPKNASKFAIYRSSFSSEVLRNVTSEVKKFYNNKIVFDNNYNLETDNEMYCTELILKAFKNNNIQLNLKIKELGYLVGKHLILFPSEFTKLPFKKVNINQ